MNPSILIVDDSETTRAVIRRVLGMCGIATENIFEAADGRAGLEQLRSREIGLVLADLHMPNMGGLEMTRHMLIDPKLRPIPVVIVSADPNPDRIAELRKQGVKGYIAKPFKPEAFRNVLGELMGAVHA